MELTGEQQQAVELARREHCIKIEAFAGSGKTTTLAAVSESLAGRGLYLAFNRAAADAARSRFPKHVDCRTAHSLAYGAVGYRYKHKLGRLSTREAAAALDIEDDGRCPDSETLALWSIEAVNRFAQSADVKLTEAHVAIPAEDLAFVRQRRGRAFAGQLPARVAEMAARLWGMMIDPSDRLPATHDAYLKLWALEEPAIRADFILFDEAQDANPVMLDAVNRQKAKLVWVGDRYQQIYSWRGAVNAMDAARADASCRLTQSFRFGPALAELASRILRRYLGADVTILGASRSPSKVSALREPAAVLARTNCGAIAAIAAHMKAGRRTCIIGGPRELLDLTEGAFALQERRRPRHRDLALFRDWHELREFAQSQAGKEYQPLVRIVEKYGATELIRMLSRCEQREEEADVVVGTAHKAKGREWPSVKLGDDFQSLPSASGSGIPEAARFRALFAGTSLGNPAAFPSLYRWLNEAPGVEAVPLVRELRAALSSCDNSRGMGPEQLKVSMKLRSTAERIEGMSEEFNLLYVAATRAIGELDPFDCEPAVAALPDGTERAAVPEHGSAGAGEEGTVCRTP